MKKIMIFLILMTFCPGLAKDKNFGFVKAWYSDKVACMVGKAKLRLEESFAHDLSLDWKDRGGETGPEWDAFEKSTDEIFNDNSIYGDCALVQLSTFLNDASGGENEEWYITSRGKRIIPIIEYSISHPIWHYEPLTSMPERGLVASDSPKEMSRIEFLKKCIDAIKAGKTLGASRKYAG